MTEMMLIEWVATASFLILVVLALRKLLGRRISAGLRYALWAAALLRLLVPVQLFTSPVAGTWVFSEARMEQNVYSPADISGGTGLGGEQPRQGGVQSDAAIQTGQGPALPDGVPNPPQAPAVPEAPAAPRPTAGLLAALGRVWLGGSAAMGLALLASNVSFVRRLRRSRIPLDGADCPLPVYAAVGLDSPCLFGLLRPAVYVTPETAADPDMLRHVLAHETTHRRHLDHVWNALRCAALAVHWWNPLVWLAVALSRRDGELACDEGALKLLGDGERIAYGRTLLALVTAKPRPTDLLCCATTMAGDKKSLTERVSRIARAPRRLLWAAVAAVLILALACACAFGRAAEPEADPESSPAAASPDPSPDLDRNGVTDPHFTADMTGIPGDVLSLASFYGEERLVACQAAAWEFNYLPDGLIPGPGQIEFDDWRITSLKGPWRETVNGTEIEVWRLNCEVHTTEPERAEQAIIGGMYLTEDGWFGPDYPDCTYLVFVKEADGGWRHCTDVIVNFCGPDEERFSSEGQAQFWQYIAEEVGTAAPDAAIDNMVVQPWTPDLNRNGVAETITLNEFGDGPDGVLLTVLEDGKVLYRGEAGYAHGGWHAVFLCTLDRQDYLLQYNPTMYGGYCGYYYKLFTLEGGQETVARENTLSFDIDFGGTFHEEYDPDAIADFMDEINGLLASSVQLVNTDPNLEAAFDKNGYLYDDLWWLDNSPAVYTRAANMDLRGNLHAYKQAMEGEAAPRAPEVKSVGSGVTEYTDLMLVYNGMQKRFEGLWDFRYWPATEVEVLDLNRDGKDEIAVSLLGGHGTGFYIENLYLFDAETLEQYDTSGVVDMILSQVTSWADGDSFRLSAPGLETEIPRTGIEDDFPYGYLDRVNFDNVRSFRVEDGRLYASFDAGIDTAAVLYVGHLKVELRLEGDTLVCGGFEYEPFDWGRV